MRIESHEEEWDVPQDYADCCYKETEMWHLENQIEHEARCLLGNIPLHGVKMCHRDWLIKSLMANTEAGGG